MQEFTAEFRELSLEDFIFISGGAEDAEMESTETNEYPIVINNPP